MQQKIVSLKISDSVLPTDWPCFYQQTVDTLALEMTAMARHLKEDLTFRHQKNSISDFKDLISKLDQIPQKFRDFLLSESALRVGDSLSLDGLYFVLEQFRQHSFGKRGEPLTQIRENLNGWIRELTHLANVNRQITQFYGLAKLNCGDISEYISHLQKDADSAQTIGIHKMAIMSKPKQAEVAFQKVRMLLTRYPETKVLLDYFLTFHDFGKFLPDVIERDGLLLNSYSVHGVSGAKRMKDFLIEKGKSLIESARLHPLIKHTFNESEINALLFAIQLSHTNIASLPPGEVSPLGVMDVLKEIVLFPGMEGVLKDPKKLRIFMDALLVLIFADVGSYGRLMTQDISYYIAMGEKILQFLQKAQHTPKVLDRLKQFHYSKSDSLMYIQDFLPGVSLQKIFRDRFEGMLTVNTEPTCPDRNPGQVTRKFKRFLKTNYSPSKAALILNSLVWYFNHVSFSRYSRHFFQILLLDKSQEKKFNKSITGFDRVGLDFLVAFILKIKSEFEDMVKKGELHPNGLIDVQTGTINSEWSDKSIRFYQDIVKHPEKWEVSFAKIKRETQSEPKIIRYLCFD